MDLFEIYLDVSCSRELCFLQYNPYSSDMGMYDI